ncbi:zinc finger protein [Macleaya cordata]|uniref:Zinc finger protein n=1 Tax=Macleaya cordata TaxID=56857 RepID=A0A200Q8Y0_MACCD|nr:zinc finger protein [Macleaya cordata]
MNDHYDDYNYDTDSDSNDEDPLDFHESDNEVQDDDGDNTGSEELYYGLQTILYGRRLQIQHEEEEREPETFSQIAENDAVEVVGVVDERTTEEEHDRSRREEGESSSSPTKNIIESQEISSKRGESNVNGSDGVCCSICMEPWSKVIIKSDCSCLPCEHVYGLSCIKKWVQRSSYSKCPQCNRKCGLEDIITLCFAAGYCRWRTSKEESFSSS